MAITLTELKELASHAARGTAPTNYSLETVNAAFGAEMKDLVGSINKFNQNKYMIFDIITENVDAIVPAKVIDALGIFADIRQVDQNQKVMFRVSKGKNRSRKFLTQVGLSGVYETFRLDKSTYSVNMQAIGGGFSIDFERFLDGADSLVELMDLITENLTDAVYQQIQKALRAAFSANAPTANRVSDSVFNGDKMFRLASTIKTYGGTGAGLGGGAVIFAPPEFIGAMGPDAIVPVTTKFPGIYHPQDIDAIHNTGYINLFRGIPVIQIPQSYTDETNTTTWIDPQLAYVLPTGGERIVKGVFEGQTQMWDRVNADQSIEIMVYKKMGFAIETLHNWGIYQNTGITQTYTGAFGNI